MTRKANRKHYSSQNHVPWIGGIAIGNRILYEISPEEFLVDDES